jgi:general secretion pathway protein E
MVGEIRDAETAQVAVRAGMTGHLVLSSLHCGRAADARARLLEMGVVDYAVGIALRGVLAQRLLRRLCAACNGSGCDDCCGTGARGRILIGEAVRGDGTRVGRSLEEHARDLVEQRIVAPAEVRRVLGGDDAP